MPTVVLNNTCRHCGGCTGGGTSGSGGSGGSGGTSNHEALTNLIGGDSTGHYHLNREQYETLLEIIQKYRNGELGRPDPIEPTGTVYDGGTPFWTVHEVIIDNGTPSTNETEIIQSGGVV